jgi:hypothetical protein
VTKSGVAAGASGFTPARRRMEGPIPAAPVPAAPVPAAPVPAAPVPAAPGLADAASSAMAPVAPNGRSMHATPDWRPFLRALAAEIDAVAGIAGRDALLRGVGLQLARMYPVPARDSLDALALDMSELLDGLGWGSVRISFSERDHCLVLRHEGLPRVGGAGEPPGTWLAGVLVGLFEGWMAQQPGADAAFGARRVPSPQPEEIVIRYGKG